jgi:hypothetical protein
VKHARKRADGLLVQWVRGGEAMGLRDVITSCGGVGVERQAGERGLRRNGRGDAA